MLALVAGFAFVATAGAAGPPAENAWTRLGSLPAKLDRPLLALAVQPGQDSTVVLGTPAGEIYRSQDYGATWSRVASKVGRAVLALAFDPFVPGLALAGSSAGGAWRSTDGGATWSHDPGLAAHSVRAFGFAKELMVAGTDRGVFVDRGTGWQASGIDKLSVDAIAVSAVNSPFGIVAGADVTQAEDGQVLFRSADGAVTWNPLQAPTSAGSIVAALAAGPLPPGGDTRPLLMGTGGGLYQSTNNGDVWTALSGSDTLPANDYTAVAFPSTDPNSFYAASDGGGASDRGGLWSTADGGKTFRSLAPPVAAVTALASADEVNPVLYVATYRPIDRAVMLWAYHDTQGAPQPPVGGVPAAVAAVVGPTPPAVATATGLSGLLATPEAPYLALAALAILVLLMATFAYLRRGGAQ